jgi:multimeric flavodoxin WrbA
MVKAALAGAAEKGAETKTFAINEMNITGCQACMHCRTHEDCAVQDDMQMIHKELASADAVVIGSPVYMWQYPAQAKIFIGRLYPYMNPDFTMKMQKPALILISQGNDNSDTFAESLKKTGLIGLNVKDMIFAANAKQQDFVKNQPELLDRIKEAGKSLVA